MDTNKARELFEEYASALAYVCVRLPDGTESIGSAFHVGDGVFVTARHVVERNDILKIGSDRHSGRATNLIAGPFFHPNDRVDIAVFVTDNPDHPTVPLGSHLDDWLGNELVLTAAIVMGFPPIPMTRGPVLVTARAEINAIIDPYHAPHPRFILSMMGRGGFSGGLVLSEYGFALGVITESLVRDGEPTQLGFFSVLSIEPIYVCLSGHKLLPEPQKEAWRDTNIWDDIDRLFSGPGHSGSAFDGRRYTSGGSIQGTERENSLILRVQCSQPAVEESASEAVKRIIATWDSVHVSEPDAGAIQVTWPQWPNRNATILQAREARLRVARHLGELISAATDILIENGYRCYSDSDGEFAGETS